MLRKYILIYISILYSIPIFSAPEENRRSALQSTILRFKDVSLFRKKILDRQKANLIKNPMKEAFKKAFDVEKRWKQLVAKKISDTEQNLIKKYNLDPDNKELKEETDLNMRVIDRTNKRHFRKVRDGYIDLVKKCVRKLGHEIPINVFWHEELKSSFAIGYRSIVLSKEEKNDGTLDEWTIKHELSHLIHQHLYWRTIYKALLMKNQSKYENTNWKILGMKALCAKIKLDREYPEFLKLMRLYEMQADIDASTNSLNSALEGAQFFLERCKHYGNINIEFDNHPTHCQRAQYLEKTYKQMLAKETVRQMLFEGKLLEASKDQQN